MCSSIFFRHSLAHARLGEKEIRSKRRNYQGECEWIPTPRNATQFACSACCTVFRSNSIFRCGRPFGLIEVKWLEEMAITACGRHKSTSRPSAENLG